MIYGDAIGNRKGISVIDSIQNSNIKIDILQYNELLGNTDIADAYNLYYMQKANIRPKQIIVYLNNSGIKIEPGAMSYFKGNIEMVSGLNAKNLVGRLASSMLTQENVAQPEYAGTGYVALEPSFKHFLLLELEENESVIVDKGMFYCAERCVDVKPAINKTISGAVLGGEGIFQLELTGPGIVVLESMVPMSEIDIQELNNEKLCVDGNFAILRSKGIKFSVTRSAKTLTGSLLSGEGLVNTFEGTGQVWLAPSEKIYNAIRLAREFGSSNILSQNMNTSSNTRINR